MSEPNEIKDATWFYDPERQTIVAKTPRSIGRDFQYLLYGILGLILVAFLLLVFSLIVLGITEVWNHIS